MELPTCPSCNTTLTHIIMDFCNNVECSHTKEEVLEDFDTYCPRCERLWTITNINITWSIKGDPR